MLKKHKSEKKDEKRLFSSLFCIYILLSHKNCVILRAISDYEHIV